MKYLSIFLALTATLFGQALKTPGVNGENIVNPAFQNAVLPTQTSNVGKYLQTNGISVTWAAVTSNITSGPVTSAAGVSNIADGAITSAMLTDPKADAVGVNLALTANFTLSDSYLGKTLVGPSGADITMTIPNSGIRKGRFILSVAFGRTITATISSAVIMDGTGFGNSTRVLSLGFYEFEYAGTTWLISRLNDSLVNGPVRSTFDGTSSIANGAITNAMLANGAVANLLGTNTGDNSVNSLYSGLAASKADDNAVVKLAGAQTITGNKTFSGLNTFTDAVTFNDNLNVAGNISGNGSAITNIPAANLTGTVNLARLVNTQTVGDANATITAGTRDVLLNVAITAARTYTLPLASAYPAGARVSFVDMANLLNPSTSAILARSGSDLINGATSYALTTAGASPLLISDGVSRWNMDIRGVARGGTGVTTLTGIVKGAGSAPMSAAVAGVDYLAPNGSAAALTGFPTLNQNTTGTAAGLSAVNTGALGGTGVANTGKTLTLGASLATTGTDIPTFGFPSAATARNYTFPTTTATLARTDAAQTFTGVQTFATPIAMASGGTGMSVLGRVGAYSNADQVLTTGAYNKVLFQIEEEDSNNEFASSTFTASSACHVLVTVSIHKSAGVASTDSIAVFKNGSQWDRPFVNTTYPAQVYGITAVVKCAAADALTIQFYAANTGTIGTAQPLTRVTFTVMP